MSNNRNPQRLGDTVWNKMPKINGELFRLTYGAMVMQLVRDYEDSTAINEQLDRMGYNIGIRLIDEFLAKSEVMGTYSHMMCQNLRETADILAKVGFKMFLGVTCEVTNWNSENTAFSLIMTENPFTNFVELPPHYRTLTYCNLLCGVIRGALGSLQLRCDCHFVRDKLKGDDTNEIRIELKEVLEEIAGDEYKDEG